MIPLIFEHHSGGQAIAMLDELADLYIEAHAGNEDESDEMFSRSSFLSRTRSQAEKAGFEVVTAAADDELAGFCFGYTMPRGTWWPDGPALPPGALGSSKFAVIELDVRPGFRGQRLSRRLLEVLLDGRDEGYATLAATPGSIAHSMYLRWGWTNLGRFEDPPVMDALLIAL